MCSSCGQKAAARMLPGSVPKNPIVFGEEDGRPAQPVTLLEPVGKLPAGRPAFATGSGLEAAVEQGKIKLGLDPATQPRSQAPKNPPPPYYVQTEPTKYVGFKNIAAAERYAKITNGVVLTRQQVLGEGAP